MTARDADPRGVALDPEMTSRIHANQRIASLEAELATARAKIEVLQSIAGGEITEQEWNSQAEIDSLTRALAFRDAALRESQAALTVAREGQAAAEREVAELRVSECWHRDRCTDLEREVRAAGRVRDGVRAQAFKEAGEFVLSVQRSTSDAAVDRCLRSLASGLHRLALTTDGTGRAGGEDV